MNRALSYLILVSLLIPIRLVAQSEHTADESNGDFLDRVVDFLTIEPNKERAALDSTIYPAKLVVAPYVLYTPETNVGFGVGGSYQFKFPNSGDEERTRTSTIPVALTYTLENQILFYSGFEIFSPDEEWVLSGNLRAQKFPRLFYGVGRDTPEENEVIFESVQLVIEPIITKQVFVDKLFLGGGFRYRYVTATEFTAEEGRTSPFSTDEISGAAGSTSIGLEAAALYDTRNSLLNAQTGSYFEFTHGEYGAYLGGSHDYRLTRADFRKYWLLKGEQDWRDVFAVNFTGYFAEGDVPLVELGQLGSGEIMRGYYEGRYTDRNYVAAQAEYRLNFENSPWGAVGFASIGDVAPAVGDFELGNLRAAAGAGVRYIIDPKERLNLRLDFAVTAEKDFNFYIIIGEAF